VRLADPSQLTRCVVAEPRGSVRVVALSSEPAQAGSPETLVAALEVAYVEALSHLDA
jgi:hypothetical protein